MQTPKKTSSVAELSKPSFSKSNPSSTKGSARQSKKISQAPHFKKIGTVQNISEDGFNESELFHSSLMSIRSQSSVSLSRIGKFIFANGDIYEGEYDQNHHGSLVRQGNGTLTCQDGVIYSGNWSNDKMNGQGSYTHPSGMKYEGEFVNGRFEGNGRYEWPDGFNYEGEFKESKLVGRGYLRDPAGQMWNGKFEGDFANGLKFKLNM